MPKKAKTASFSFSFHSVFSHRSSSSTATALAAWSAAAAPTVKVWKLRNSNGKPALANTTNSASIGGGQQPGFLTSVSSNGKNNAIIWALSHPTSKEDTTINLFAFNPDSGGSTMTQLFKGAAGSWTTYFGQSNLVPMVANGQVYVAGNKQLQIFGILPGGKGSH